MLSRKKYLQRRPRSGRTYAEQAGYVVFWLAVLVFYTLYFGHARGAYRESLVFVVLLLPITMATTYFLTHVLIPRYLLPKRYGLFALYFGYTLIASVDLEMLVVMGLFIVIARYEVAILNPIHLDVVSLVVGMYVVVFLAVAIDLLKRWYTMQSANASLKRARLEAELKLKEAELKLLKAQIHPHFLFNTLNNLYSLTLERSDRAPDVVLRISDMLDYMLYRGNAPRVSLQDEVTHIENYLALEQLRYDDRVEIEMTTAGAMQGLTIAPMLLIPFVENSFKHGISQQHETAWVRIHLAVEDHTMTFTVTNSTAPQPGQDQQGYTEGIGLKNVQKRLDLLYPDAHQLTFSNENGQFEVILHLRLDDALCVPPASS